MTLFVGTSQYRLDEFALGADLSVLETEFVEEVDRCGQWLDRTVQLAGGWQPRQLRIHEALDLRAHDVGSLHLGLALLDFLEESLQPDGGGFVTAGGLCAGLVGGRKLPAMGAEAALIIVYSCSCCWKGVSLSSNPCRCCVTERLRMMPLYPASSASSMLCECFKSSF